MFSKSALVAVSLTAVALGQQIGTNQAETHPKLTWQTCTGTGSCQTNSNGAVVLDANWRWTHNVGGFTNCYTGNLWDNTLCPDGETCATNCAVDGADYAGTYGITSSGNALTLKFVTFAQQKNVGSRVYLMADDTHYQIFQLLNKEFTFDVDLSGLPCGINGALYFSEMDADGGLSKFPTNKAGAKYGTGYCDSQCPRDIKFINGVANSEGWVPSPSDPNAGTGNFGSCCGEMDVWEANSVSSAFTAHPCTVDGQTRCSGEDCAIQSRFDGVCDPDGCDFNSFRTGVTNFYGRGMTVDTSRKFTVVTQFLTNNNSTSGTLSEIRRIYVQDGRVIQNTKVNVPGIQPLDSITTNFCTAQKSVFGDTNSFGQHGGLANMSKAMAKGMVLVLSIWDDHAAKMLWLDSDYPIGADPSKPGVARGTCAQSTGDPNAVEAQSGTAQVIFSNIRFGTVGSTFTGSAGSGGTPTTVPSGTTTAAPAAVQTKFGQCGGQGWTGPTACASGSTCQEENPFFSQCL